jgi:hypothetical protein
MIRIVGLLFYAFFIGTSPCLADSETLHMAAHVGTSFAINTLAYGICRKTHMLSQEEEGEAAAAKATSDDDRIPCLMVSSFTTLLIGFAYKEFETGVTPADFQKSMIFNGLGTGLAIGSVFVFDF